MHLTHFTYGYMVKDHSDSERGNPLPPHGQGFFNMHHSTDRITHTMAFVTPVMEHWLEREIAQWVRRPMAPWANALTTELHLAPFHEAVIKQWPISTVIMTTMVVMVTTELRLLCGRGTCSLLSTYASRLIVILAFPSPISFFAVTLYAPPSCGVKFWKGEKCRHSNQGLKRILFHKTRQYNIQMFNKIIFFKYRTIQIKATKTNK